MHLVKRQRSDKGRFTRLDSPQTIQAAMKIALPRRQWGRQTQLVLTGRSGIWRARKSNSIFTGSRVSSWRRVPGCRTGYRELRGDAVAGNVAGRGPPSTGRKPTPSMLGGSHHGIVTGDSDTNCRHHRRPARHRLLEFSRQSGLFDTGVSAMEVAARFRTSFPETG